METYNQAIDAIRLISEQVESHVDLDEVVDIASSAPDIDFMEENEEENRNPNKVAAIAYDSAFSFYYQENLDQIAKKYTIKLFSPINNEKVDGASLIYLGGGYPELFVKELSQSQVTMKWISNEVSRGTPLIAECGGLMYLSSYIKTKEGSFPMAKIYDIGISFDKLTLGYRIAETIQDSFFGVKGTLIRGHEFHTSSPEYVKENNFVFKYKNGRGILDGLDGARVNNSIASYLHVHFNGLRRGLSF